MKTRVLCGVVVSSVVLLASCMQDREATPLLPTQARYSSKPVAGPCVAQSTTNNSAKAYFSQTKDPVFALLDSLYKYQVTNANVWGYQVLTRLAYVVNAPASANLVFGTPAQGSTFANYVLGCMSVTGYTASTGINFAPALSDSGLFAVRSDSRLDPVVSRKEGPNGPLFGAERKDSLSTTWNARIGTPLAAYNGPILFYGSQLDNPGSFINETTVGAVFDLSSLPAPLSFLDAANADAPVLQVGVCDVDPLVTSDKRILHEHGGANTILPNTGDPRFCALTAPPQIGMVQSPFSRFAAAAERVANWFAPQPLMAYKLVGGSGSYGGLSRGGAVTFNVPADSVTFFQAPYNSRVSLAPPKQQFNPPISVRVATAKGNAVSGVKVSLTVVGNSGSFTAPADSVRVTDAQGLATFSNFYLDKAGGYTITAHTSYGDRKSNLFNINGK